MSILDKVAQVKPTTWDNIPLPHGKNYVLKKLNNYSDEYEEVLIILQEKNIPRHGIQKIERVQHPFAYGSFLLRKKQLELRGYTSIEPKHVCLKLDKSKLEDALEYNLDKRRIGSSLDAYFSDYFESTTISCVIIAKCLKTSFNSIERDSEIYPEYVVYYN